MQIRRKQLAWVYYAIGIAAWVLTSLHLPSYIGNGFVAGTELFWKDALLDANSAGKFLAVDIFMLGLAVIIWMFTEARAQDMRGIWLYVLVAWLIGISLAVPVFLGNRERAIARAKADQAQLTLRSFEVLGIVGMLALTLFAAYITLS